MILAGTPTAVQSSGTSVSTTAFAPMATLLPMRSVLPITFAPAPMNTLPPIMMPFLVTGGELIDANRNLVEDLHIVTDSQPGRQYNPKRVRHGEVFSKSHFFWNAAVKHHLNNHMIQNGTNG